MRSIFLYPISSVRYFWISDYRKHIGERGPHQGGDDPHPHGGATAADGGVAGGERGGNLRQQALGGAERHAHAGGLVSS